MPAPSDPNLDPNSRDSPSSEPTSPEKEIPIVVENSGDQTRTPTRSLEAGNKNQAGEGEPANEQPSDLWEQIGFHRPLGGFMYNYVLGFVGIIFGLLVAGLLISVLYPYPESKGYRDLSRIVFVWFMPFLDFGVAFGIERFIGEWRVKDQAKMVEYIRFFAWYQLISSCLKTTIFSAWTFTMIRQGDLAYLSWNILLLAIQHYPGFLYLFRSCLAGLQHYHKASLLNVIGSEIFDKVFLLIFIFMWRDIGNSNPSMGELMTISFGTTFAYYMRDFFMFGLQIYFIKPVLAKMGLSVRTLLVPRFSRDVVKTAFKAGASVSVVSIVAQLVTYIMTMMYVDAIFQFTTFMVLSSTATSFLNFIDYFGKIDLTAPFSEAFRNEKRELSLFYLANIWKYWGYVNGAMLFVFAAFLGVISQTLLAIPGLENYALLGIFIVPAWVYKFFLPLAEQGDTILVSSMRLKTFQALRILEEVLKIAWVAALLYIFQWQRTGITAIAYLLILAVAVPQWVKTALAWIYIRRRLLPYKIPVWQAFGAPFLSGGINFLLITLYLKTVHAALLTSIGAMLAGVVTMVFVLVVFPPFVFPFFYGLLGGWDDFGLQTYQQATTIAGPSRFFFRRAAMLTRWSALHSPLTGRFPIPHETAVAEIKALTEQKRQAAAPDA